MVSGFDALQGAECSVEHVASLGLAVISAPEPLHYYSLFSHTAGCDVVLARPLGGAAPRCFLPLSHRHPPLLPAAHTPPRPKRTHARSIPYR